MPNDSVIRGDDQDVLETDESVLDDFPEAEGTETQGQETSAPAAVDWESRFKGLQGTVQTYAEQIKQLRAENAATQFQMMQSQIAQLPEEQQGYAKQQLQLAFALQNQQQSAAETERLAIELAKKETASRIAKQYGVKADALMRFNHPDDMEYHAQTVAAERRRSRKTERKQTGADRFEGGGSPLTPPKEKAKSLREARERMANRFANR